LVTSAREGTGLEELKARLGRGRTAALLGPSGVGKSSLVNALAGEDVLEVAAERNDGKGRHTTTFRQLVVLPGAGVLVDTPGVRELGLWESAESVDAVFVDLADLASGCRFSDCAHDREPGCAIRVGLADGTVSPERLASGRKLQREVRYREARLDARVAREERRRWKAQTRSSRAPRRPGRR
ncbi:MAG: ribosome small subunit-dependent GTPase A, partial [Acidimicrobiales bacterium]